MKRTLNIAIIATMVLGATTVAFAALETGRAPQPSDVSVMVTDRSTDVTTPTTVAGGAGSVSAAAKGSTKSDTALSKPAKTGATAKSGGTSPSKGSGSSGKKTKSVKKPAKRSGGGGGTSDKPESKDDSDDDDDGFEVVKPPVHDDGDDESDDKSDDKSDDSEHEVKSDDSKSVSSSGEGD